ncbi:MAG TPA: UDP-N-acetylmuramoyl-L-alanyl-D-glutamate--2,6-diaminopimelate ligase [Steroidobacteraceae bacterium]|nr:UDP-N-acetylmuramoyl-L-alanyl-D-glutamate--2,6-diaminopimelate ligase [Steroidobacteraceae bacterium]
MSRMTATVMQHIPTKSLHELLAGMGANPLPPDFAVSDLTLDSRTVTNGAAFVALPGLRNHGIAFAPQAIANGAAAILWEPTAGIASPESTRQTAVIAVADLGRKVGELADRFFSSPSAQLSIAGVTGTNGKTTSAYLVAAAFSALNRGAGYAGTLGYGHIDALATSAHTTADCITVHRQLASMRDAHDQYVGMEVSSHALDQGRIDGVRLHSALFTNLTRDHLDYHGTLEAYGAAKEKLFFRAGLQHCALNAADPFGREVIGRLMQRSDRAATTAFASTDRYKQLGDRQLFATHVEPGAAGLRVSFDGSWGAGRIDSQLIGGFNVENILGVLAILLGMDVTIDRAIAALERCSAPPGRMETLSVANKPLVVIDYAHTPDALSKALQTARAHAKGRVICVFGCGGDRDAGKRPLMGEIAEASADVIVLTDDNPRMEDPDAIIADIQQGLGKPSAAIVERDRAKAIERAIALASPDDLVLIAGKGHEDYQIVGRNVKHFSDREQAKTALGMSA